MIMACLPVSTVLLGGGVFIHKLLKQQIFKWWTAKEDSTKHSHLYYMLLLVVEKKSLLLSVGTKLNIGCVARVLMFQQFLGFIFFK